MKHTLDLGYNTPEPGSCTPDRELAIPGLIFAMKKLYICMYVSKDTSGASSLVVIKPRKAPCSAASLVINTSLVAPKNILVLMERARYIYIY